MQNALSIGVSLLVALKVFGKEFEMTFYDTLSCCDCGVLFEDEEGFIEEVSYLFYLSILQI